MQAPVVSTPSISDQGSKLNSGCEIRIQSAQLGGTIPLPKGSDLGSILMKDVAHRICEASDDLIFNIFPDDAFGFSFNERFAENFHGIFLSPGGTIDAKNFPTEAKTATFLNKIITTVACFFHDAGMHHLKPLRYFSSLYSSTPVRGAAAVRKPDIVLLRLVDGSHTRKGIVEWKDVQALVEHTVSKEAPIRMPKTVTDKNYLMFCAQPERNFIINLCITGTGIHAVVSDHAGQVDTDSIPFDRPFGARSLLRMVVGFAFLPDEFLGIDSTIIRRVHGQEPHASFKTLNPPFQSRFSNPQIAVNHPPPPVIENPLAITTNAAIGDECPDFDTITIGDTTYKVLCVLFQSPAFIGRATKVFLVRLEDGRQAVLKDSFITIDRPTEESLLRGLTVPFGPSVIDHCILGDTRHFRASLMKPAGILETRQKRRVVTYPAGVHISDFTSLWELVVAFLDVAVAVHYLESQNVVHRDISYTNILLRYQGRDSPEKQDKRRQIMCDLGLSDIEALRGELGCREGLLVDFDYASLLNPEAQVGQSDASGVNESLSENQVVSQGGTPSSSQVSSQVSSQGGGREDFEVVDGEDDDATAVQPIARKFSGARTGTPPFMAIELLLHASPHRAINDAESLIYVLLFLCSHLEGPGVVRSPPLLSSEAQHPSGVKHWLSITNLRVLGHTKYSQMVTHMSMDILSHLSTYFKPLSPHIAKLWTTLFPAPYLTGAEASHSLATLPDFINALRAVLLDSVLIDDARAPGLRKRSLPGDVVMSDNGWDAVPAPKKQMVAKTGMPTRHKFMRKGHPASRGGQSRGQ